MKKEKEWHQSITGTCNMLDENGRNHICAMEYEIAVQHVKIATTKLYTEVKEGQFTLLH